MFKNDLKKWLDENKYDNCWLKISDSGISINNREEIPFDKIDEINKYKYDCNSFEIVYKDFVFPNVAFSYNKLVLYSDSSFSNTEVSPNVWDSWSTYPINSNNKWDCDIESFKGLDINESILEKILRKNALNKSMNKYGHRFKLSYWHRIGNKIYAEFIKVVSKDIHERVSEVYDIRHLI